MIDVRFYLITINGRILLDATSDEEALAEARAIRARYPIKQKRIIRETHEILWEAP